METILKVSAIFILTAILYLSIYSNWAWTSQTMQKETLRTQNSFVFPGPISSSNSPGAEAGLNKTTCLWISFRSFGRSGNKVRQIMNVKEILSRCSGVASSTASSNGDPVLAYPPVLFATKGIRSEDPSTLLALAAQECQELVYNWDQVEKVAERCSPSPIYSISVPVDPIDSSSGSFSPALLANVFAEHAFWKHQITTMDTMVMYFRGGDVLTHNEPAYFQGPCSLFLESWKAANASRVVLVYDRNTAINPCVEVVREAIGNTSIVPTPCDSAGCHMMMVGRASYFCDKRAPHESSVGLEICVDGESEGLVPWSYTNETRQKMMELPSQIVLGDMNTSIFRQYLQQGDNDHMARRMRL